MKNEKETKNEESRLYNEEEEEDVRTLSFKFHKELNETISTFYFYYYCIPVLYLLQTTANVTRAQKYVRCTKVDLHINNDDTGIVGT